MALLVPYRCGLPCEHALRGTYGLDRSDPDATLSAKSPLKLADVETAGNS